MVLEWGVKGCRQGGNDFPDRCLRQGGHLPNRRRLREKRHADDGNCNHRRYLPHLIELVRTGALAPAKILTQHEPMTSAIEAYKAFDKRQPGWIKVKLESEPVEQVRAA